jgi:hypothetical protein
MMWGISKNKTPLGVGIPFFKIVFTNPLYTVIESVSSKWVFHKNKMSIEVGIFLFKMPILLFTLTYLVGTWLVPAGYHG